MDLETHSSQPFSMSIGTLFRIHNILELLNSLWPTQKLPAIKLNIRQLHKEVYPFLKPEEETEAAGLWLKINQLSIVKSTKGYTVPAQLYYELESFEFWLRKKLKEHKLLMKMGEDMSTALGR